MKLIDVYQLQFSRFDESIFPYFRPYGIRIRGTRTMLMSKSAGMMESAPMAAQASDGLQEVVVANDAKGGELLELKSQQI